MTIALLLVTLASDVNLPIVWQDVQLSSAQSRVAARIAQFVDEAGLPGNFGVALVSNRKLVRDGDWLNLSFGSAFISFHSKTGAISSLRIQAPDAPGTLPTRTREACLEVANDILQAANLPVDTWSLSSFSDRDGSLEFVFHSKAFGRNTMTAARATVDRKWGVVVDLNISRLASYNEHGNDPVLASEKCLQAGLDAYARHSPFKSGRLVSSELMLGTPFAGSYPRVATNWLAEHVDLHARFVAIPLYRLRIEDAGSGYAQGIDVDARTARVLSIYTSGAPGHSTRPNELGHTELLKARTACGSVHLELSYADTVLNSVPEGSLVLIIVGNAAYSCLANLKSGLVWIPSGKSWHAYAVPKASFPSLKSAIGAQKVPFVSKPANAPH